MQRSPTDRQRQVLRMVHDFASAHGYAPTLAELRDGLRVSSVYSAVCHVRALQRRGLLEQDAGVPRSIRLTSAGRRALAEAA